MNETALQVHGYFDVLHTNCTCPSSMKTDVYAYELKRTESEVSLYACSSYFENYYALACTCLLHMHYTFSHSYFSATAVAQRRGHHPAC